MYDQDGEKGGLNASLLFCGLLALKSAQYSGIFQMLKTIIDL